MDLDKKIVDWSSAHVFYNLYTNKPAVNSKRDIFEEYDWRMNALTNTPNGSLMTDNSFFRLLKKGGKLYFLHITPNLKLILESGSIYSSGGCLMGGVYATPLFPENGRLRLHNLGKYIYEEEAPRASYYRNGCNNLDAIIIETTIPHGNHDNLIGIDYTKLGKVHLGIYRELEYLLSFSERLKIYKVIIDRIRKSIAYLDLAHNSYFYEREVEAEDFLKLFISSIENLPILGYLYFEVVAEYIMLFQDSPESVSANTIGEFYNPSYKNLMFEIVFRIVHSGLFMLAISPAVSKTS